ncbi:hypothetical protein CBL_01114 [Carabus blaptoides fortunei]
MLLSVGKKMERESTEQEVQGMAMALLHNFAHNSGSNGGMLGPGVETCDTRRKRHIAIANNGRSGGSVCDGNVKIHESLRGKTKYSERPGAERNGHTEPDSCR